MTFNSNNILGIHLKNNKDKTENNNSGIYTLQCGYCEKCYMRQTSKNVEIRMKEHYMAFKNKQNDKSAYTDQLLSEIHDFDKNFIFTFPK